MISYSDVYKHSSADREQRIENGEQTTENWEHRIDTNFFIADSPEGVKRIKKSFSAIGRKINFYLTAVNIFPNLGLIKIGHFDENARYTGQSPITKLSTKKVCKKN